LSFAFLPRVAVGVASTSLQMFNKRKNKNLKIEVFLELFAFSTPPTTTGASVSIDPFVGGVICTSLPRADLPTYPQIYQACSSKIQGGVHWRRPSIDTSSATGHLHVYVL
jgi:hypothetical protein